MVTLSDYEAFKRKEKAAGAGAAGIVLGQEFAGTPDEAAGDLNLAAEHAKATGAPVAPSAMVKEYRGLFQRNLDTLKAGTILSSSPTLSAWLREPDNAAVSRDDLENLSWFEQQGRGLVNAVDRGVKQIQLGMDQSAANSLAQRAADRGRSFDEILQDESKKSVAGLSLIFAGWRQSTAMLDAAFGNDTEGKAAFMQQRAAEMQAKIAEIPKSPNAKAIDDWMTAMDWSSPDALSTVLQNVALNPIGFAEWVTQTGAEVAPQIAAATAVTAATRNPTAGAAVFGGSSYLVNSGAQSLEFVQEAGYDLATPAGALAAIKDRKLMASAAARGQAYGLVVGAMDTLSGGLAAKELAKSPAANLFLQTLLQSGLAGAGELSGQVVASMPIDPASIFGEMLAEVGSAPAEVAGIGGRAFLDKQARAKASEDRVNMFKAISGQAVASKLRERMPDKFRQFIERATADGPVENVFVPADKFVEYFQSKGLDPAKVLENLPGVTAADLDMALETGGDLKIPTASYAASIAGSNHDAWMVENMRFNPDEFTAAEAKEFNAKIEDAREEAYQLAEQLRRDDDELRSVEQEIYDTMTERLRAAGRATDVATTEAMLYPAFYRTMAERSGLSTEEFLARYPLPRIEGAAPAGMQLKDVTALKRTLAEARTRRAAPVEKGMSLLEFIDNNGGVIDTGGDIAAMDAATIKRGKGKKTLRIVRKANPLAGMASMLGVGKADTKGGLDDMARAAYEAGYMANDPRVMAHHQAIQSGGEAVDLIPALLDAIRSEMAGVRDHGGNVTAADATDGIDTLEEYLSGLGVSLDNTDEEIRAAMERGQAPAADGAMYAQGKIDTSSAAFKEWFGNSKIVDENGKPMIVYHGSPSKGIDTFRMDDDNYKTEGTGFWFTNEVKSGTYSGPGGEVYPVYLKMERPIVIEWDGHWTSGPAVDYVEYRIVDQQGLPVDGRGYFEERKNAQAQLDRMAAAGRDVSGLEISETPIRGEHTTDERVRRIRRENPTADGVILRNVAGGGGYSAEGFGGLIAGDEFVVFEPTQIKSVNNRGTWSANDPNILNQSAPAERNMFVAHNLSPDGLMNVVKMGGLPMPSLAVARVDRGGFDGFGSITLLGSPDLIDPKGGNGAKTYNADAYSPRYPSIYYDVDEKKFNALNVPLVAAIKEYGGRAYDAIDLSQLEDRGPIRLPVSYGLKLGWLKENGLAPAPVLLPDGTLHWYGGRDAIDAAAAPHEQAIKEWAAEKLSALVKRERIFKGFTPSGNRRYVDHTIENVLADMRARLKEGEGWNYGVGSARARFAKVFKSITGMQADRDKLVDAEATKAVKDGFDDRFGEILEALRPYYRFDQSGFGYMDDASAMIGEMATKGTRALDEGFKDIPAHVLDDVKQFTADLASAPTGYFETKINRIVSLSEFTAAIVPSDLAPKYVEALKAAGLNVRAYDRSVAGARNEAIMAVDKDRGGDLLFQPADGSGFGNGAGLGASPRGMIQFPAAGVGNGETIISTFAGADLSTVLHESGHYFLTVFRDMALKDPTGPMGKDFDAIKDWWHENAAEVARDANAAVQGVTVTADDVRLALDAGTSGDALKDQMINVGMQEQFARGVEAYLMEGKAPSIGLRSAFEKFRAWLISIYRRALGLNVAISDEMRGVFDRLLATDQEIAEAKQQSGATDPIFATAEEMGLSPEDYAKFRRLYKQANDEAAAATLDRIMAPIRRAKTAIYKAERKAVVADVTAALQNEPVYRAIQELRFGKGYDGEDVPAVKLSREAIEKDYGLGHIGFLPGATKDGKGHRNAVFSDEGGVHPDVVAGMYGFASGEAFLDALEKAPDLKDVIEAEVEKEMAARHSDPMTDGSVQRVALQATHSDKRGQVLAAELKALNDVAGYDRGLTFKEARETARRTLRGLPVRDAVRSDRFLAAERKAGEQAFTLGRAVTREGLWMDAARRKVAKAVSATLRAEDGALALGVNAATDKANENTLRNNQKVADLIEAKRRQLLNHMLYDESRKVADGVDALVKKAGKLNKSDAKLAKARNIDYVRAARAIAAKFGLARPESDFDFGVWIEQLRVDDAITADALTTAIATYTQDAKPYKDMTVAELGALADAIESVLEVGKRARLLEVDGQAVDRELAISELRDVLDQRPQSENKALSAKLSKADKVKVAALSIVSSLRRMEAWARDMDDGEAGVFTRYLVKPVMDAVGIYREDKAERLRALLAIIEPRKADLLGKAINAPELGYTFENKGEFLHALLHTGNESNLEKLLLGRGWSSGLTGQVQRMTPGGKPSVDRQGNPLMTRGRVDTSKWDALVARLISEGTLTKEDYETAQAIWNLMDTIKRPAQSAHRKVYGYYFQEVEPSPLVTPFGTFRGGYVPAIADGDASNDGQIRADQAALEAQQTSFMFPTTGAGFTKARVQNYTTPLSLNLMLLPAHMDKVLRFTHLNPVIRQTASLVNSRELRAAIDAVDKTILPNLVTPWLQRTAQQAVEAQPTTPAGRAASNVFRELRKRVGVHTMFLNLVNTAQQVTGFSSAAVLVKPARLKSALARFAKGGAGDMRAEASAASLFMRDRIENSARELNGRIQEAIVKPTITGGIDAWVQRHGYVLQQGTQNVIDVIAWHAAYDQAIGKGASDSDAVFEADSVIRRTMGDFSPENLSMFETGSAFTRLFTMFYSYFNGQANLVGGEMQTVMRTMGWSGAGRMFFIYLFGIAIPAIVGNAIVKAAGGGLDDDEEDGYLDELLELFFGSQLSYVAGMIPGGSVPMTMLNRFNGQFYDDRISTSPVVSAVERAVSAPGSAWKAATGDGSARKAVTDGLTALGLVTGIPMGQLAKMAGYATGVAEGSSRPDDLGDVMRGLASGRDGSEN